jgi:hypothetical protein
MRARCPQEEIRSLSAWRSAGVSLPVMKGKVALGRRGSVAGRNRTLG